MSFSAFLKFLRREPTSASVQPTPSPTVESSVIKELLSRSLALETKYHGDYSGDEVFPEDCPLAIARKRTEYLAL